MMTNQKLKILPYQCEICQAPAHYSYFGVISCFSCKMFFKRNANRKKRILVCDSIGQCEININNRSACSACRLMKCFKCGMTTDKFRPPRQKSNISTMAPMKYRLDRLPTLNLLQSDTSLLTTNQWTLLSNLYHTYEETQILSIGQYIHKTLQLNNVVYQTIIDKYLACIYETTGTYLQLNGDLRKISSNDRSIILRSAADNVACMTGVFSMQQCYLYSLNTFVKAIEAKYGKRTTDIHQWAMKFIDSDIVLVKLGMSLFAFSENACVYSSKIWLDLIDPIIMFEIQNKYAEVTWKYLIYRYGFYEATRKFLNLTLWLRAICMLTCHAQNLTIHTNDVDSVVEQTELLLILDDVNEIIKS
ncbi:unnamed protein product [Adineta steineri]|uniref:Nuclear receptor domain-containing protein n=1 Tax=Adineta steineri TaxID=433720 RepID=A0A815XE72_9BILA|nr:unnamed protein product [Adineta steineri]